MAFWLLALTSTFQKAAEQDLEKKQKIGKIGFEY